MECWEKLLAAFQDCGEAAILYRGKNILMANEHFAKLFELRLFAKVIDLFSQVHKRSELVSLNLQLGD